MNIDVWMYYNHERPSCVRMRMLCRSQCTGDLQRQRALPSYWVSRPQRGSLTTGLTSCHSSTTAIQLCVLEYCVKRFLTFMWLYSQKIQDSFPILEDHVTSNWGFVSRNKVQNIYREQMCVCICICIRDVICLSYLILVAINDSLFDYWDLRYCF